jgi:hypothetical protein
MSAFKVKLPVSSEEIFNLQGKEEEKIYNYFMQDNAMAHTANMTAPEEVRIKLLKLQECLPTSLNVQSATNIYGSH